MFDKNIIQDSLIGLVGFNQPFNPDFAILDSDNLTSRSGYFVNDNPFAKIESIKGTIDYADISDANFNLFLKQQQKSSIAHVCNSVFDKQDFRERNYLYKHPMNKVKTTEFADGFVGYQIRVTSENNVAFCIDNILTDFEGTGTVEVLLYSSENKAEPIERKTITITKDRQLEPLNWTVNNTGGIYKGEYYLGYIKSGSTPKPYKREYDTSNILSLYKDLSIDEIIKTGHTGDPIFDLENLDGNADYIGLNPDIIIYDDFTSLIMTSQKLFAYAINLDMAIKMINIYVASVRSNQDERKSNQLILALQQVNGQDGGGSPLVLGLIPRLKGEIENIKGQIEKLKEGLFGEGIFVHTRTS